MKYMDKITKMLGLEPGEGFKISGMDDTFWLDDDGLCIQDNKGDYDLNALMMALLTGRSKVEQLPWKPTEGTLFYSTGVDGKIRLDKFIPSRRVDLLMYKAGMIHRTQAEAEAHKEEDKKFWDEIMKELEE